jgi:hypothetical protein
VQGWLSGSPRPTKQLRLCPLPFATSIHPASARSYVEASRRAHGSPASGPRETCGYESEKLLPPHLTVASSHGNALAPMSGPPSA